MGNYGVILSLLGCLDHGLRAKKLVDRVIDSCKSFLLELSNSHSLIVWVAVGDHVVNLREDILIHRIKYSLTNMGENSQDELVSLSTVSFYLPRMFDDGLLSLAWEGRQGTREIVCRITFVPSTQSL